MEKTTNRKNEKYIPTPVKKPDTDLIHTHTDADEGRKALKHAYYPREFDHGNPEDLKKTSLAPCKSYYTFGKADHGTRLREDVP